MALVCAALLVAPETIAAGPIYGVQSCSTPRVQPTRIVFACVDAGALIHNVHWRHWGGRIAVGSGTYWEVEACRCRARSFRATVWLGDVGACPGHGSRQFYRRAKVAGVRSLFPGLCPISDP